MEEETEISLARAAEDDGEEDEEYESSDEEMDEAKSSGEGVNNEDWPMEGEMELTGTDTLLEDSSSIFFPFQTSDSKKGQFQKNTFCIQSIKLFASCCQKKQQRQSRPFPNTAILSNNPESQHGAHSAKENVLFACNLTFWIFASWLVALVARSSCIVLATEWSRLKLPIGLAILVCILCATRSPWCCFLFFFHFFEINIPHARTVFCAKVCPVH